jgi:hypothetical protein
MGYAGDVGLAVFVTLDIAFDVLRENSSYYLAA